MPMMKWKLIISVLQSRWTQAAWVIMVSLWWVAAWFIVGMVAEQRQLQLIHREQQEADKIAEVIHTIIRRSLVQIQNLPTVIAGEPSLAQLLSGFGSDMTPSPLPYEERHRQWRADPRFSHLAQRLTEVVAIDDIGINACWVMNAAGDTVVVGTPPQDTNFTGANYVDRDYFQAARQGQKGHQFAVGRVTGVPGLFFVSPVMAQGRFLGAVGVRTNLDNLSHLLGPNTFIADQYDVIILAHDPDLRMRTLPDARVAQLSAETREQRYKRREFATVSMIPAYVKGSPNLIHWRENLYPSVLAIRGHPDDLFRVYIHRDLREIENIQRDHVWLFALLSLVGFLSISLIAGTLIYIRALIQHSQKLAGLNEELARQARTDPLTGCANRRSLLSVIDAERQRAGRYMLPFSVLGMDLDYFKQINDRYGHAGGDQALRHFVALLQGMLRPTDTLGRMGGEEFTLLLPQTRARDAVLIAERLRAALETSPVSIGTTVVSLTVSVGVAQWRQAAQETAEQLLGRADQALYAAKQAGRNQVQVADSGKTG